MPKDFGYMLLEADKRIYEATLCGQTYLNRACECAMFMYMRALAIESIYRLQLLHGAYHITRRILKYVFFPFLVREGGQARGTTCRLLFLCSYLSYVHERTWSPKLSCHSNGWWTTKSTPIRRWVVVLFISRFDDATTGRNDVAAAREEGGKILVRYYYILFSIYN